MSAADKPSAAAGAAEATTEAPEATAARQRAEDERYAATNGTDPEPKPELRPIDALAARVDGAEAIAERSHFYAMTGLLLAILSLLLAMAALYTVRPGRRKAATA